MARSRRNNLFLSCVVVCGVVIVVAGPPQLQPAKAADKEGRLKEWEYPDAESLRSANLPNVVASADYAASRPFEEVWSYYAKKIGYKQEYKANDTFSGGADQHEIVVLNSTSDPAAANARRPSTKSTTFIRRGAGGNITVFISRAKDEEKTYITVIVEEK